MEIAKIRKTVALRLRERYGLEQQLLHFRNKMVQGSLLQIYTACRKGNCRCTKGKKHGPFLYMSTYIKGKKAQRYVGKKTDRLLVEKLRRYHDFQKKLERSRKLSRELSALWNKYRKELINP